MNTHTHTNTIQQQSEDHKEEAGKICSLSFSFLQSIPTLSKGEMKGEEWVSLKNKGIEPFEKWREYKSNMKRGMKDGVGTVRGGHVMTSDVVNQLDGVLQESGSSSH